MRVGMKRARELFPLLITYNRIEPYRAMQASSHKAVIACILVVNHRGLRSFEITGMPQSSLGVWVPVDATDDSTVV